MGIYVQAVELSDAFLSGKAPGRSYRRVGLSDLSNTLQYALAQTAQIKQALEAGDVVTAISVAAGTPWTTKPSVQQVEAMVNDPKQGAVILQKLYDSIQPAGYRSPLPNTMPLEQLKQALQKYLSLLTPSTTAAPVKAVQDGTINVVNTSAIQSFAQWFMPVGTVVPKPVTSTSSASTSSPAPAGPTPEQQKQAEIAKQTETAVAELKARIASGEIQVYAAPADGQCPPDMERRALPDGSVVCIDPIRAKAEKARLENTIVTPTPAPTPAPASPVTVTGPTAPPPLDWSPRPPRPQSSGWDESDPTPAPAPAPAPVQPDWIRPVAFAAGAALLVGGLLFLVSRRKS